jgi:hypothetical protein
MWVMTDEGELVNLDHVEFIRVEEDEDSGAQEVRAYPAQAQPDEELYYVLASAGTGEQAGDVVRGFFGALSAGNPAHDFGPA